MPSTLSGPSKLVRQLAPWTPAAAAADRGDVAEHLSHWFDPLAAIRLQAVLPSAQAGDVSPTKRRAVTRTMNPAADVQRVRGTLARAIAQDPLALAGIRATHEDPGYAPWRQRHGDLQRQMAQMAGALRDHLRQAAGASARLQPLAALDSAFGDLLAEREQALLATTMQLLDRRYQQLHATHRVALKAAGEADDPSTWRKAPWLATFAHDWQQALLAELDLRLEPAIGLAETLRNDSGSQT